MHRSGCAPLTRARRSFPILIDAQKAESDVRLETVICIELFTFALGPSAEAAASLESRSAFVSVSLSFV